jgi:hypothetical protein
MANVQVSGSATWEKYRDGILNRSYPKNYTFDVTSEDTRSRGSAPIDDSGWRQPTAYSRSVKDDFVAGCQSLGERGYMTFSGDSGIHPYGYYGIAYRSHAENFPACTAAQTVLPLLNEKTAYLGSVRNEALNKLLDRGVYLAETFGEHRQTIGMVTKKVLYLTQIARAIRRGNVKELSRLLRVDIKKIPKHFADGWLEYTYGWKPLVQDIYDLVEWHEDHDLNRPSNYGVHTTRRPQATTREVSRTGDYSVGVYNTTNVTVRWQRKMWAVCRYDWVLDDPVQATLAQVGLTNPLRLAWELLPYSFVCDWIIPVGEYLSAMDATRGWNFKAGSETLCVEATLKSATVNSTTLTYIGEVDPFSVKVGNCRFFEMQRSTLTSEPRASIAGLGKFGDWVSSSHLITAISLFVQQFYR